MRHPEILFGKCCMNSINVLLVHLKIYMYLDYGMCRSRMLLLNPQLKLADNSGECLWCVSRCNCLNLKLQLLKTRCKMDVEFFDVSPHTVKQWSAFSHNRTKARSLDGKRPVVMSDPGQQCVRQSSVAGRVHPPVPVQVSIGQTQTGTV